tara:strand:+ start:804 stop:1103 length:300 start_codon:yes stop_codon:yes gene_type:complete
MQISGSNARTDVSSRPTPAIKDDARFSKIETVTIAAAHGVKHLTGSLAGSSGFIVKTAGTGVITATDGGDISTSDVTAKEMVEIGVQRISGSCTVHVVY